LALLALPRGLSAAQLAGGFGMPDRGVPRMRSPPCAGDRFLVNSSPAMEQIYEHRPNSKDIHYPAAETV
jgi:hypothetical protein